jgi:hypothetical protein
VQARPVAHWMNCSTDLVAQSCSSFREWWPSSRREADQICTATAVNSTPLVLHIHDTSSKLAKTGILWSFFWYRSCFSGSIIRAHSYRLGFNGIPNGKPRENALWKVNHYRSLDLQYLAHCLRLSTKFWPLNGLWFSVFWSPNHSEPLMEGKYE